MTAGVSEPSSTRGNDVVIDDEEAGIIFRSRSQSPTPVRRERSSGKFAVEEALFLAQSRAREAEEALSAYDSRMEEAVMKALKSLDASRERERESLARLQDVKQAILAHERVCNEADRRRLDGEDEREMAVRGPLSDPSLLPALHPALDPEHEMSEGHARWQVEADEVWREEKMDQLSEVLAKAYEDVREAKESTALHTKLIEGFEGLVEPILQYRHKGVLPDLSATESDTAASLDGSSVVFVQRSDAITPDSALATRAEDSCFSMLVAKLKAVEDAHTCRELLGKVQTMLEAAEELSSQSSGRASDACKRMPKLFDKVNNLLDLVKLQQQEISELKSALASVHSDTAMTSSKQCPSTSHQPPPPERESGTPMQKRKRARYAYVASTIPGRVISAGAATARQVIDMWERFMLESLSSVIGLMGKLLGWVCMVPLLNCFTNLAQNRRCEKDNQWHLAAGADNAAISV